MKQITIGRSQANDIVINNQSVSSNHAVILIRDNGEIIIRDLNSTNGTYVNGKKITEASIRPSDRVQLCDVDLNWTSFLEQKPKPPIGTEISYQNQNSYTIGRSSTNNIVFPQSDVSSSHATITKSPNGEIYIQDNNSVNGTYVNGRRITYQQLFAGDQVLLANKYAINWEKLFGSVPIAKKRSSKTALWIVLGVLALVLITGAINFQPISKFVSENILGTKIDVNEKYKTSVVLVYQSFVYEVTISGKKYHITKDENGFKPYVQGVTQPIQITGTGFFVSQTGEIITNRHVAIPWEYTEDKSELEESIKNIFMASGSFADPITQYGIVEMIKNLNITGVSINIGVALNDSYVTSPTDFIPCVYVKDSGKKEIDVAMLQTKSKTLPANVKNVVNLKEALVDDKGLKVGEHLYMIGYPAGFTLANTQKGIMANFQNGQITRLSDGVNFGHNVPTIGGGSGSPIFDDKGRLVGINYEGLSQTQGFNMAMLAKYAVNL